LSTLSKLSKPAPTPTFGSSDSFGSRSGDSSRGVLDQGSGAPREWAEGFARLDAACPPGDIARGSLVAAHRRRRPVPGSGMGGPRARAVALGTNSAVIVIARWRGSITPG
jgi:hypothetical protein